MIPFVVTDPKDPTEIVNLMAVKRVCDLANGKIAVHFVDGKILEYEGQAAQIIKGSCHMARAIYEQAVMQHSNRRRSSHQPVQAAD
jgi:hypothetical protein